jgi:hypothetical protein
MITLAADLLDYEDEGKVDDCHERYQQIARTIDGVWLCIRALESGCEFYDGYLRASWYTGYFDYTHELHLLLHT